MKQLRAVLILMSHHLKVEVKGEVNDSNAVFCQKSRGTKKGDAEMRGKVCSGRERDSKSETC